MVRTMAEGGRGRKRLVVIAGEMLELGPDESALHRETGREIAAYGIDELWGIRGLGQEIVFGAREGGVKATMFLYPADEGATALMSKEKEGVLFLEKGSRK